MKVTLIGDSIRINSQAFVREHLPQPFEIAAPSENCESSRKVVKEIQNWIPSNTTGIVHLNCGLHDIRHDPEKNSPVSSPDVYVANLREIFKYLASTATTVIWATSTPINELAHNSNKLSRRYQADLLNYNSLSTTLARSFGFKVNDLYDKLLMANGQNLLLSDGVHFNQAGNELVGKCVAAAVLSVGGA